jgi:GntR family transcriptional regulator/MocR family aminotransferase
MRIDLFVDVDRPRRTSASLFEQIRDAIANGRLAPGDRLPTSRELAVELGIARSTVAAVYGRLVGEGFLQARTGDGTFVAALGALPPHRRAAQAALSARGRVVGPSVSTAGAPVDLRTGRLDPSLFPLADWRRCVTSALHAAPPGYGDHAGLPALRRAVATWVGRSRGVHAGPQQVLVTAGAQQAFDLIARVLLAPGDVVAVEDPGYPVARRAFEAHGLQVAPVPVDADGIVVDAIPSSARAVYVTPSHQSPTGVAMTGARRRALLAFADASDAAIIEDDYDTEFRWVDRPLEPIQRLDAAGRVLYVGTFSKTLSPSLRLGFALVPEPLVEPLAAMRSLVDTQPPHLTQAALAELITSGLLDRHLRRARRAVRPRFEAVTAEIAALHADGLVAGPLRSNAGLHAMVELLPGADAAAIAARLRARGVAIDPADEWCVATHRPGLLVGFGLAGVEQLRAAFAALRDELER